MPPSNGRRWAREIAEALPEAKTKGGVAYLLYALVELAARPKQLPANL